MDPNSRLTSNTITFKCSSFSTGTGEFSYTLDKGISTSTAYYLTTVNSGTFIINPNADGTLTIGSDSTVGMIITGTYSPGN